MAMYEWPEDGLLAKHTLHLACIISGRSDFRVADYILHVPAGNFILIPPGVPHPSGARGHIEGKGYCDILWLTLWSNVFRCWICHTSDDEHRDAAPSESCFIQDPRAAALFQALAEEATTREARFQEACASLLRALWIVLHRRIGTGHFFQSISHLGDQEKPVSSFKSPVVSAQQYIRTHFHEHLTLANVAQHVYLSRAQFAQRFHEETGETFNAFVTRCRLEEAKRLLVETDWPISAVSESAGITPMHLRSLFLRDLHQSPREYRNAQRAANAAHNSPRKKLSN
jgi:AraC-like DNA-binding protein